MCRGLPYSTTEQHLSDLFAPYGSVHQSAKIIMDTLTGQSRGFAFVEMAAADEAQKAITALNGTDFGGRSLVVNEACPQENRAFGGDGGGGRSGGGDQRGRW